MRQILERDTFFKRFWYEERGLLSESTSKVTPYYKINLRSFQSMWQLKMISSCENIGNILYSKTLLIFEIFHNLATIVAFKCLLQKHSVMVFPFRHSIKDSNIHAALYGFAAAIRILPQAAIFYLGANLVKENEILFHDIYKWDLILLIVLFYTFSTDLIIYLFTYFLIICLLTDWLIYLLICSLTFTLPYKYSEMLCCTIVPNNREDLFSQQWEERIIMFTFSSEDRYPLDTGCKLNLHEMSSKCSERLLYFLKK